MEHVQYFNIFINKNNTMNKQFLHMQKLAGLITESEYKTILNEKFTNPVYPLRIWEKNNAGEGKNEAYFITVVGGLMDNKEVSFSKEEIEALHKIIDEWFKSQQSGFNKTISVNTKDKNFTQATVGIKKLKDFDVEISRIETTAGMSQYRGYGDDEGGGICIIKVANMYQLKDDKNLKEAIPTAESIDIEKSVNEALKKFRNKK